MLAEQKRGSPSWKSSPCKCNEMRVTEVTGTRKTTPLFSSAGTPHTLTTVGREAWENTYLWNTLVSVPESSFELGGCGRQPEGTHFQVKFGLQTSWISTKWMWGRRWSTWEITGVPEEIEEQVQWKLDVGILEGRANNGGRRNSCREVHWGRVVARRGIEMLGMIDLLLGEEATWKQWETTQYSWPKKGMCEQWQSLKPGMKRLWSLGSSYCKECGKAGWTKKGPRAFLCFPN